MGSAFSRLRGKPNSTGRVLRLVGPVRARLLPCGYSIPSGAMIATWRDLARPGTRKGRASPPEGGAIVISPQEYPRGRTERSVPARRLLRATAPRSTENGYPAAR